MGNVFFFHYKYQISLTFTAASGNVTTGPQAGSPGRPRDLVLSKTISAVKLAWTNGNSGRGPILGYYIESRRKGRGLKFTMSYGGGLRAIIASIFSPCDGIAAAEEWQICEYY